MKARIDKCDIAVVPYNYVLDKKLRNNLGVNFENSVIIFDEGHNLEHFCEEIQTFDICRNDLFLTYTKLVQTVKEMECEEQTL